jgi:hypothetical protein
VCSQNVIIDYVLCSTGVFVRSILWIFVNDLVPAVSHSLSNVVFCAVSSVSYTIYLLFCAQMWCFICNKVKECLCYFVTIYSYKENWCCNICSLEKEMRTMMVVCLCADIIEQAWYLDHWYRSNHLDLL